MPSRPDSRTAGLVLAAGASVRLGRPKQLLPYRGGVVLDAVLATARASGFDQIVLALGGAGDAVRDTVDTAGCDVVDNPDYDAGCSSSIAAAIPALHPQTDVLVLLLGDQPGVSPESVRGLLDARGDSPIAVCRYDNGIGHPFAFDRTILPDLAALHGDKGLWRLLDRRAAEVTEVRVSGPIPLDIDTEADYERALAQVGDLG
ncbi:nucleotidyltransferase family protein [Cryobacterium tagatosivorans]|uniref:Nucleotidyltransferase family protein n=1 Tax=Cryobacterium tagatosivorans TaxID=1259199 RepID=A0A4R8UDH3_9MICO|nr:nucleotidyltransferase family protein [Cryobacterium tagatosivorans]TFB49500.1 nucleotidyltransferase family protein [Cryobacterium tagatosivorans]